MPATGGPYEFRLLLNNGYTSAATSPKIAVVPLAPVVTSLSPSAAVAGTSSLPLTVSGSNFTPMSVVYWNGSPRTTTYVAQTQLSAAISSADLALAASPRVSVVTPAPGGGTSNAVPITITQPPALTVNTTSAVRGGSVTVTLTGGLGGASDWLALAATSAPVTNYLQWTFVGTGVTTRTWTIAAPTTPGVYEFRLFLNNGYTRAATSATVTVQ